MQRDLVPGVDGHSALAGGAPLLSPQVQIKEETRLVSVIDQIDKAVAIIPRGALFKTPFGPTHVNRTFEGKFSGALLKGWGVSFPKHNKTYVWESSGGTYTLYQRRSSCDLITWKGMPSDLAPVVSMGSPVSGP